MNRANICVDLIPINKTPSIDMIAEYNDLFRDMAMQYIYGGSKDKVAIDSSELANILNFELNRSGISTPFDFALLDGYSFRKIISSYSNVSRIMYESAYKAPIRINTGSSGHAILMIDFPKKRAFIFQANKKLLSFSFLFILLIAGSFAASIFIIFRQKRLSELKTDFINNMTHELKTPVATISLATEMLSKEKIQSDKTKVSNYTSIIDEENKRLGNHIEKVLQIAQMGREVLKLKKESIDIHQVLDDVIRKYKLRFDDDQANLLVDKHAVKTVIFGDKTHIYNVLSNLIDNALKYRSERSLEIEIKTENEGQYIIISVKDNGVGISKNNIKKIFTQFYRVPSGNIHNVKGFGLGLSYVKSIVEKHNGTVEVDSELNKYATFSIKLPLLIN
jgi:two-component system phosphate regulon sensor histidine kinase PhoR